MPTEPSPAAELTGKLSEMFDRVPGGIYDRLARPIG
jgi:hypothetical protein